MLSSLPEFTRRLLKWYGAARRTLPWRVNGVVQSTRRPALPDPYHVLVSEAMLQQTQVATVIPYFNRFIARFPTLTALAEADEQEVLRFWQGLGYYSRARNLRAAACRVIADHGGAIPCDVARLLELPGVGRYTAGAVASLAFDRRAPILDGNVARVLCRLDRIESDPRGRETQQLLWRRAEGILPARRAGDFNSALMELGATVCTPRAPQCLLCPVRGHCEAYAGGVQERIPAPRKAKPTPLLRRWTFCIERPGGEWLIEQRPATGRWAGLWQFITVPAPEPTDATVQDSIAPAMGLLPVKVGLMRRIGTITHGLTHRRYQIDVFRGRAAGRGALQDRDRPRAWTTLERLGEFPLSRPHLRIAELLAGRA
jgi:A/G-specific adenine glycosylase